MIGIERDPVRRYNHGLITAVACLSVLVAICVRVIILLSDTSVYQSSSKFIVTDTLQLIAALISFISCLSLPRRPQVSDRTHIVDGQYTVSAFTSYTFGFAGRILLLARQKPSLDLVDLPKLHLRGRSSYLLHHLGTVTQKENRLWKALLLAHWPELLFQILWAIIQSTLQFAPQLVMYQLLKLLEEQSDGASRTNAAWGLVVALGGSMILASWTQAWMQWICWARLGQPLRTELSAMIFSKSLRRKDVKGVGKATEPKPLEVLDAAVVTNDAGGQNQTDPLMNTDNGVPENSKAMADDPDDEDIQKSRQSTINLVVSSLERAMCAPFAYEKCS